MPTRTEVLALVNGGRSYEEAGRALGIRPGLAYLIATGLPADGGDVWSPQELEGRPGLLPGSTQQLANPPVTGPDRDREVMAWLEARATADAAMQAADAARTAEPPPVEGRSETDDVVDVLGWDHNQVKFLEEQLSAIPGVRAGGSEAQQRQRASIVDMITVRLSQHEVAEEEHFWPAVRRVLDDGDQLADTALAQEQEGKDLLTALGKLDGTDEEFDELVEQLVRALRTHVAFEDTVFLAFRRATTAEQRAELGRTVVEAKGHAPTRPHPHAPDHGPALRVAAAAATPLDKARDALGARPATRRGRSGHQAPRKAGQ